MLHQVGSSLLEAQWSGPYTLAIKFIPRISPLVRDASLQGKFFSFLKL